MSKPIWALDVDGVINAVCQSAPSGYKVKRVDGFRITYDPTIIARIADLHTSGQVEVRWLTTWQDKAQSMLAKPLGLPAFDLAGKYEGGLSSTWWKFPLAAKLAEKAPLIWSDDDLAYSMEVDPALNTWVTERQMESLLALSPDTQIGLTHEQVDVAEEFVARHHIKEKAHV